jgi:glutathione S-transferase
MIDFHYVPTGNNLKIAIALEELGLPYRLVQHDMFAGTHQTPEFRRINPNAKLPAILDHAPADAGPPLPVFESGAILLYLAEKSGRLMPVDWRRRHTTQQWLVWQVAGLGPMLGQANHFVRYAPEGQQYAVERYLREAQRLLAVLDRQLRGREFIADEYSIADIACVLPLGGQHAHDRRRGCRLSGDCGMDRTHRAASRGDCGEGGPHAECRPRQVPADPCTADAAGVVDVVRRATARSRADGLRYRDLR